MVGGSLYELVGRGERQGMQFFKWGKNIWNRKFMPSMAIFNWRVFYGFIPADDILKLKGNPTSVKVLVMWFGGREYDPFVFRL